MVFYNDFSVELTLSSSSFVSQTYKFLRFNSANDFVVSAFTKANLSFSLFSFLLLLLFFIHFIADVFCAIMIHSIQFSFFNGIDVCVFVCVCGVVYWCVVNGFLFFKCSPFIVYVTMIFNLL